MRVYNVLREWHKRYAVLPAAKHEDGYMQWHYVDEISNAVTHSYYRIRD